MELSRRDLILKLGLGSLAAAAAGVTAIAPVGALRPSRGERWPWPMRHGDAINYNLAGEIGRGNLDCWSVPIFQSFPEYRAEYLVETMRELSKNLKPEHKYVIELAVERVDQYDGWVCVMFAQPVKEVRISGMCR